MAQVLVDWSDVWGYHNIDAFDKKFFKHTFQTTAQETKTKRFFDMGIAAHNTLNATSIVASPLVGIVRAILALVLIKHFKNLKQEKTAIDLDAFRSFLWVQMGRGVMEFFCLGPILGLFVDPAIYCRRNKLLCFKG